MRLSCPAHSLSIPHIATLLVEILDPGNFFLFPCFSFKNTNSLGENGRLSGIALANGENHKGPPHKLGTASRGAACCHLPASSCPWAPSPWAQIRMDLCPPSLPCLPPCMLPQLRAVRAPSTKVPAFRNAGVTPGPE